jgi:hypothetical protein
MVMGVAYAHYLIPRDNTYKPDAKTLVQLIDALVAQGFLPKTSMGAPPDAGSKATSAFDRSPAELECYLRLSECAEALFPCPCAIDDIQALGDQDYRIVCSVSNASSSGLEYPLAPTPESRDAYYEVEIHMGRDYIYHVSEIIAPFDSVACRCGQGLQYLQYDEDDESIEAAPAFRDFRIQRTCPSCGTPFRPQDKVARMKDGWTGETTERPGGATYLFAVVVDCGKGFARDGGPIRATDEFHKTVARALGQELYEVAEIY